MLMKVLRTLLFSIAGVLLLVSASVLALVGMAEYAAEYASHQAVPATAIVGAASPSPHAAPVDYLPLLQARAVSMHLGWTIFCTNWMPDHDWQFQGSAWRAGDHLSENHRWHWTAHAATQAGTVRALYEALGKPPTLPPDHGPREPATCPPPIAGGAQ